MKPPVAAFRQAGGCILASTHAFRAVAPQSARGILLGVVTTHQQAGLVLAVLPPCSDLAQHGVVLVVTGAGPSIRPLLLAHGVPLPPALLSWPPEMEAPEPAGGC